MLIGRGPADNSGIGFRSALAWCVENGPPAYGVSDILVEPGFVIISRRVGEISRVTMSCAT
jgi:hypothetical protein